MIILMVSSLPARGIYEAINILFPVHCSGTVLEGFLRFPETTQDFPTKMGVPLFSYKVSRAVCTGFCFDSKLRKCSEDLFGRH